jgi:hypothetical protein
MSVEDRLMFHGRVLSKNKIATMRNNGVKVTIPKDAKVVAVEGINLVDKSTDKKLYPIVTIYDNKHYLIQGSAKAGEEAILASKVVLKTMQYN